MEFFGLIIAIVALIVSFCNLMLTKKIALVDRKTSIYIDAIVYLDKLQFINTSPDMGFNDSLTKRVTDEWTVEQILIAADINSRLKLIDNAKAQIFWEIISNIFSKDMRFDYDSYQKLRNEIINELNS